MFYWLYASFNFLGLFKYLTFRLLAGGVTSFIITMLIMPRIIKWVRKKSASGQPIRNIGLGKQLEKQGTPTLGGLGIIIASVLSVLLWVDLSNLYVWLAMLVFVSFGLIGFIDDMMKLKKNNHNGISARVRILLQALIGLIVVYVVERIARESIYLPYSTGLAFPFVKNFMLDLSYFYFIFGVLVIIGSANAVNLTDGMDGLVSVPLMSTFVVMGIFAYFTGSYVQAAYLNLFYIPAVGEVAVVSSIVIGALLGFLWYNSHPAEIFMGDTGSLALGGLLGFMAVMLRSELVLAMAGIVFVITALSVILQVVSYKLWGKRIFKIAPIHHHFEATGVPETKIVIRTWIISIVFAAIALASLKIR